MSIANFKPVLWSKGFLYNLNRRHVHADVMNRDYEGEIRNQGDTVRIGSIGRVTINNYTTNSGLGGTDLLPTFTAIARPEVTIGSDLSLHVDQAKYFNVAIDDVDKKQAVAVEMDKVMKEAAYAMANTIDLHCNSVIQTGVAGTTDGTGNRLAARTLGTGAGDDDAYETLVDLGTKLKEADVFDDMWVIVPPWFIGLLQKDVRFTNYGTGPNRETLLNGNIGKAAGFDIKESNNLSGATSGTLAVSGGVYTILAGVKSAATFAEQIAPGSVEAFRPHDGFTDAVKGLQLYGSKVTRPFALASCAVTKA